ncbi:unnamed protein product [Dovyalis caffra]|uniref:Aberrant root formation protein 4 n=1 Tax=Dovyalis caffra TaxID=77055 RepID=A0AAV1SL48_9ROSI|nr:unnamed protein product [Dovyalis caffra]
MAAETGEPRESSSFPSTITKNHLVLRLHEKLSPCSTLIESGDEKSVAELVDFINSVSDSALSNLEDTDARQNAVEVLSEIHKFLLFPSVDQAVIDALSFELPKAVSKFAGLSDECLKIADNVVDRFIEMCSPRDMLPMLCEALDSWNGMIHPYDYVAPLLSGISKVFLALQRRHFEQVKAAIPVILNVLKAVCSEFRARDTECLNLFIRALGVADSIREICAKLEGRVLEKLRDVLGSYILQIMVSAPAAGEDMSTVKDELLSNQTKRWQAIGMLKHIFSSVDFPWELKKHAIDFLLCITDGNITRNCNDEDTDCYIYMPDLYTALQAITMLIMYTPDTVLRKNAFVALKRVRVWKRANLVRSDLYREGFQRTTGKDEEMQASKAAPHWVTCALELVELVLRPPKGGPPSFPEHGDAVLAALNLYRFILMTESAGKTNYTGVLSKKNLEKVLNEWLLPLRALVTGIMAENKDDHDPFAMDTNKNLAAIQITVEQLLREAREHQKAETLLPIKQTIADSLELEDYNSARERNWKA